MTEKQKNEALRLMRIFSLSAPIMSGFAHDNILWVSQTVFGRRYADADAATAAEHELANNFAKKTGNLTYHMIRSETETGVLYTLLYINPNEAAWQGEAEPVKTNRYSYLVPAYRFYTGYNLDRSEPIKDNCGEYVTAEAEPTRGALLLLG